MEQLRWNKCLTSCNGTVSLHNCDGTNALPIVKEQFLDHPDQLLWNKYLTMNEQILWNKYLTNGEGTNSWPIAKQQTVDQWL